MTKKFNENLNYLMTLTSLHNATLSKITRIDPSLISRYKSGERIPSKNGKEIEKISIAFTLIKKEKLEILMKEFNTTDIVELKIIIYEFLNNSILKIHNKIQDEKILLTRFSEKLNVCMNLINISNFELAKYLNIDPSLLSRYRNNLRPIYSNNKIIESISDYITKDAETKNKIYELFEVVSPNKNFNKENMKNYLITWFKSNEKLSKDIAIENFLVKLSTYKNDEIKYKINKKYINSKQIFIGEEGLKKATFNFLYNIHKSKKTTTIHLYTNNDKWIYENENFKNEWNNLLGLLLKKGNNIIIYKDIDYSVEEMIKSVSDFMDLYYTGNIEYRYVAKTKQSKFSVNFFLADNLGYLYSSGTMGSEKYIEHKISFNKSKVKNYQEQFKQIVNESYDLLKIKDTSNQSKFINLYKGYNEFVSPSTGLLSSPFIGTINISILNKILERNKISGKSKEKIMNFYNLRKASFEKMMSFSKVTDYVLKSNHKANLDLKNVYSEKTLYYTEDEYIDHLKYLKVLSKKYPNYNVKFISNIPFDNLKIMVKKGYGVVISKEEKNNKISFLLQHEIFINTFINYISLLENN